VGTAVRPEAVEPCTTNGGGDASRALKLCTIAMELALRHYNSSNVVTPGHVSQAARFIGYMGAAAIGILLQHSACAVRNSSNRGSSMHIVAVAALIWQALQCYA
jgi:hypothetical protein